MAGGAPTRWPTTNSASPAVANGIVYEGEWDAPFLYAFSQ